MNRLLLRVAFVIVPLLVFFGVTALSAWFFDVGVSDTKAAMIGAIFAALSFIAITSGDE